jgi:hypothetical protein
MSAGNRAISAGRAVSALCERSIERSAVRVPISGGSSVRPQRERSRCVAAVRRACSIWERGEGEGTEAGKKRFRTDTEAASVRQWQESYERE